MHDSNVTSVCRTWNGNAVLFRSGSIVADWEKSPGIQLGAGESAAKVRDRGYSGVSWHFAKRDLIFHQVVRIVGYEKLNRTRTISELPLELGLIDFLENVAENDQFVLRDVFASTMLNVGDMQMVQNPFDRFSTRSIPFKTTKGIF